jgi:hypothetical protein
MIHTAIVMGCPRMSLDAKWFTGELECALFNFSSTKFKLSLRLLGAYSDPNYVYAESVIGLYPTDLPETTHTCAHKAGQTLQGQRNDLIRHVEMNTEFSNILTFVNLDGR